ncbi:MAG: F0F1 ATP synthase subunit A [Sulfurovum sp.]|uniref:F0F1 ATP synthase subunit A n=1 Tax=Sulfurovum sp. TaxID=1969726 RepID=UPI002867F7E0|nr:F0F1 ATP synthase subunit A [Sulfurovum sp.]MCO4846106.1 F0F1 ATP synthase subunit A [Sulfurovum sp.]
MEGIFTYLGAIFGHGQMLFVSHLVLTAIIVIVIAKIATKSLSAVPAGTQNVMEAFLGGVIAMGKDVIGEEHARKYLPLIATIGLFVLVNNLIGIIPGFESPTSNINVTLTLALIVFLYYNYEGIKKQGAFTYFKNFVHLGEMHPIAKFSMSLLMYPIEIVSHLSRIVSLSFRLFGNIKGDDLFLWVLLMLTPWIIPITPLILLTFMAFLQTFVFMILTYVYLAGALALEEDH